MLRFVEPPLLTLQKAEQVKRVEIPRIGADDGTAKRGGPSIVSVAVEAPCFFEQRQAGIQPRDSAAATLRSAGASLRWQRLQIASKAASRLRVKPVVSNSAWVSR